MYSIHIIQEKDVSATSNSHVEVELLDLTPYTNYTIYVRSRPVTFFEGEGNREGKWSVRKKITVLTREDVPGGNPPVHRGSFQVILEGSSSILRLYWQVC